MQPLISIVVPVYNVEKYLPACIESVQAQTFKEWELILVDDGSTDSSGEICDRYAKNDARIKVIHKGNSGPSDTRNIGIQSASAELVGFVDSDDWIDPDMYEVLYDNMVKTGADISLCGYYLSYRDHEEVSCNTNDVLHLTKEQALHLIIDDKLIKSFVVDKLYKKKVLSPLLPVSRYYEDHSTTYKWFFNAEHIVFVRSPKYHYRQRSGSIDNGTVDPVKKFHYFLAESERYAFLKEKELLSDRHEYYRARLVRSGLRVVKEITVGTESESVSAKEYMTKMRHAIQEYLPISPLNVGIVRFVLLKILMNNPELYKKTILFYSNIKSLVTRKSKQYY